MNTLVRINTASLSRLSASSRRHATYIARHAAPEFQHRSLSLQTFPYLSFFRAKTTWDSRFFQPQFNVRTLSTQHEYYSRRGQGPSSSHRSTSKSGGHQQEGSDSSEKKQEQSKRTGAPKGFTTTDPYKILGLQQDASAKEVKRAYFESAKLYHPDLHPDDPSASLKFQQVADAYEILGNERKRRDYDMFGQQGGTGSPSAATGFDDVHADAAKIFKQVWKDLGLHELEDYFDEVRMDMSDGLEALKKQDYDTALMVADRHKGLIISTFIPLALVLRFPGVMLGAVRLGFGAALFALRILPPEMTWYLFRNIWMRIVYFTRRFF